MRLTRKKAIELCKELWTWCMETGKPKEEWPKWDELKHYGSEHFHGEYSICNHCWFCEYSTQRTSSLQLTCGYCPYHVKYGHCFSSGVEGLDNYKLNFYGHWYRAKTPRTRKKYAKLFHGQIETLK